MDRKAVARELRQKLFDFIEAERREALQDAAIDKLFEDVLAKYESPAPLFSGSWLDHWAQNKLSLAPGSLYYADASEIGIIAKPDVV